MASTGEHPNPPEVDNHWAAPTCDEDAGDDFDIASLFELREYSAEDIMPRIEPSALSGDAQNFTRTEGVTDYCIALTTNKDESYGLLSTSLGREYGIPMENSRECDDRSSQSCRYEKNQCLTDEYSSLLGPKKGQQQILSATFDAKYLSPAAQISCAIGEKDVLERSSGCDGGAIQLPCPILSNLNSTTNIASFLDLAEDYAADYVRGTESSEPFGDAHNYSRSACMTQHHNASRKHKDDCDGLMCTSLRHEYNRESDDHSSRRSKGQCMNEECSSLLGPTTGQKQILPASFNVQCVNPVHADEGYDVLQRSSDWEGVATQPLCAIKSDLKSTTSSLMRKALKSKKSRRSTRLTNDYVNDIEAVQFLVLNSEVDVCDDGYSWLKYGKKNIKRRIHPRTYSRCAYRNCPVKKRSEASSDMQGIVSITYFGRHNHPRPLRKTVESR
ncbi:hypothetical protein KP509_24G033000 [Ceratopteris richardii]|uniref:WRKY domain-containing protein n=1 Tax=Ceratopteris richardii TaxID=49495 RepID=A0A8T2RUC7_CERRI|nr:hypothetical protein KP509_24G033000 [Ceratopteris richardii]